MNKNMMARIAVALVAIPSILWICYQGGWWLWGLVTGLAMIAINEFLYNEKIYPKHILFWLANIFIFWNLDVRTMVFDFDLSYLGPGGIVFLLLTGMILSIGKRSPAELFSSYTHIFWGVIYIGMLYPFVIKVGSISYFNIQSGDWLLFLFAILWVGDSAALFIGKAIGKHRLAPSVSPNKTIEGFVGGLLGAIVVGVIMSFWKFNSIAWYHVLSIAFGCSIFGQLGDLVESMWKRSINIKDSSNIIPGHGGILDRFDSLLFAAPFMYFYKDIFLM